MTDVQAIVDRMRVIDETLPAADGAAVFNHMYLTVTEGFASGLGSFADPAFMADLGVRFAGFWLAAYDTATAGGDVPRAWDALFEARDDGRIEPIQYALAGMNAHIEHDLPLAVVATCAARGASPDARVHEDYEAVNALLAAQEAAIRRSFLPPEGVEVDNRVAALTHLLSAWKIDKARDLAWVTVEALWALRRWESLQGRYADALARTVGMASRCLLAPCL
jgi:hypothetical protein